MLDALVVKIPQQFTIAAFFISMMLLLSGCGFNTIPTNEEKVHAAWSEVLNQYQRRADLVPNLIATVKAYATHEKDVLTSVVEARAKATQTTIQADMLNDPQIMQQYLSSQANLSSALFRLMAISENYPDLKANQNFLSLQSQLEGTENRITIARRDYIEAVRIYNTALKTMPTMLWAKLWFYDAAPIQTFTIDTNTQQTPQVNFD
ncbi:LemA family protein [Bartonella ancashensis]|uniref:LemA family protein n=1 Tax=Bartonella ancashensis TaxID=1318743 RepID=A0A0M5L181_9HYPH|nr:LemA family protein [Bartonella ancashensis]ALE03823.1 LemA family protein [Bartonella ancashensis]